MAYPPVERQAELTAYLAETPGTDVLQSINDGLAAAWPEDGLHISSLIRPGFNGNVTITPYRTAEISRSAGYLLLRGCGLFAMVYENRENISNTEPNQREYPDFMSLSLAPALTEIIPLENSGRLLVPKATTDAKGGESECQIETRQRDGVVSVERLIAHTDLRPLMLHLATGMGLEGGDVHIFAEQPFRKIERYINPEPPPLPGWQKIFRRSRR